jgi:DNA helicase-2/ATP-dependent DNA helicase PcrA
VARAKDTKGRGKKAAAKPRAKDPDRQARPSGKAAGRRLRIRRPEPGAEGPPAVAAAEGEPWSDAALNEAQARAASTLEGPLLVIAGAGTGKTRTLVHRLVRLVEAGVPAESILLLTFTRRAAQEMIGRAAALLGGGCRVAGGTFHSFANGTLRRHGQAIGLPGNFTVLDQADTFEIISSIRTELGLGVKCLGFPRRQTIAGILSKANNKQISIHAILEAEYAHLAHEEARIAEIGRRYAAYKRERGLLDFDDLLVQLARLLEQSAETRARVCERYRHVMVDEYQDTNLLQARITSLLAGEGKNVMVVGDDAQSIYAFRGAYFRNLFDFRRAFRKATLVTLEENYRSTQPILDVSNAILGQMSEAFRKQLFTRRGGGERPLLVEARDEEEQARYVADEVGRLVEGGTPLREIAVLYRAGSHALALEIELTRRKIPYVKYGGFRFTEAAHVKDALAHLRVVAHPADDLSLVRVLVLHEGIGRAGALKVAAALGGRPLWEHLDALPLRRGVRKEIEAVAALLGDLDRLQPTPARALEQVVEHYAPILKLRFDDWPRRQRDLEQLVALCQRHESLEAMLAELAIEPPTRARRDALAGEEPVDELVLSTMHSSKGLEWRAVFVIQALDGCVPLRSMYDLEDDPEKLDEELRLLYVAVTRAKDRLTLVYPRMTARGWGYGWAEPSSFIQEMPVELLDRGKAATLLRGGRARRARRR